LFHLILREDFNITKFEDLKVEKSKLNPSSIKELTLISFMYQTGYLTIKEISAEGLVKLNFPNFEVESNFLINLLDFMTEDKINSVDIYYLRNSLVKEDNHFLLSFYGQKEEVFKQLKAESETEKDSYYISMSFDLQKSELAEVEIKN